MELGVLSVTGFCLTWLAVLRQLKLIIICLPKRNSVTGVPQGSVIGHLLLLIYINDIYTCSDKLSFSFFADDTNLLYADKNLQPLEAVVNN